MKMKNDEEAKWDGLGTSADEASRILNYIFGGWEYDEENNLLIKEEDDEWWGDF